MNRLPPQENDDNQLASLVGAPVAIAIIATIALWEGRRLEAYRDPAGIWTICDGDTRNVSPGQRATSEECDMRLNDQAVAHLEPILRCVPTLRNPAQRNRLIASTSLAYNIGTRNFCRSKSVAVPFRQGRWEEGCHGFLRWNRITVPRPLSRAKCVKRPTGKWSCELPGLTRRRKFERDLCLTR